MVQPVIAGEIFDSCALAGGGEPSLDRVATGGFGLAGVLIGFAESVEEDMALERPPTLFQIGVSCPAHGMRQHPLDGGILAVIEADRRLVHMTPSMLHGI